MDFALGAKVHKKTEQGGNFLCFFLKKGRLRIKMRGLTSTRAYFWCMNPWV